MSRGYNVLIIAQLYPPDIGGGATRAHNVAKGLLKAGCNVTVVSAFPHYPTGNIPLEYKRKAFTISQKGKLRVFRTYVPSLPSEGLVKRLILFISFVFSSLFVLHLIRKVKVVWAANPNIIAMFPAFIYRILHRCPIVQNVDDLWPETLYDLGLIKQSFTARLGEFFAKLAYRLASAITPISPAYVRTLRKKYKVNPEKIHVVPAGVDLEIFSTKRKGSKSSHEKFVILYIGAFSPAYDFDQVFKAAKLLSKENDIAFVLQGSGELAKTVKQKIKNMKLQNTSLVEKIVDRKEVAQILSEADVLLLPLCGIGSIELGISSKLYEYQAAGKPIICCSSGQPARYVSETKSGIVVKPGDYRALAEAVLVLKRNPALRRTLERNARRYVEENLGIDVIGTKMKEILENL